MTTNLFRNRQHVSSHIGKLRSGQSKGIQLALRADRAVGRCLKVVVGRILRGLVRRTVAHVDKGHEPTRVLKNRSNFFLALVAALLSTVFSMPPAFGHDPPVIAPTQLDFDASHAPQNCNDVDTFSSSLEVWVPRTTWRDDADHRLIVRIQWSSGHKEADVSLVDTQGVTLGKWHEAYAAETECHYVLWIAARHAAELLGAFEPPPPKEPPTPPTPCPTFTAVTPCPTARPCLSCPPLRRFVPTERALPMPYRFTFGIGAFVGSGIYSKLNGGPYILFGFIPSRRLPELAVEFEGS